MLHCQVVLVAGYNIPMCSHGSHLIMIFHKKKAITKKIKTNFFPYKTLVSLHHFHHSHLHSIYLSCEMASKVLLLLLSLNLLFFATAVSSTNVPCPPPPKGHKHHHPPPPATCPKDTLKLGVCANLLNDLVHLVVGTPPKSPCCTLIQGLADLEAAVCLCTAIKANVLGINLNVPVSLSLLLNYCGKKLPSAFHCA